MGNGYLRLAALGDSTTVGLGDPLPGGGWRGWARLLAEALQASYDVSFCNVARSGATAASVREQQLAEALAHRPDLASLPVGVNDTLRSTWDPERLHADLAEVAGALVGGGATLMTVRWHDHAALLGLPRVVVRPMAERIALVNEVYDDLHATYGGLRLDLALMPEVRDRTCWSIDRFHPSELGHRALARAWGERLHAAGFDFPLPSLERGGGCSPSWRRDVAWMVTEGAPWFGRRARDLGPWAVRRALAVAR
ncbi:SGNH/GDSL hydrolase family protein [Nocardioides daeguensis]|uniref:SGNH/GDSL hydrolase family protein n=1 Tax=Nocardioides daeguensis TaxID=908359 RepID=A0ABP6UQX1_9ACTN|nr:SGNH/GDSL hydrolase family protein [Nocardioides daeguensis]MBV6729193.1 SGNH/GDSL hydrolase family protein [Nocardioides daeguensis]MCR1774760.1 SGNH/GDSL hydrolase family protein [Nocardioides daeguensis]